MSQALGTGALGLAGLLLGLAAGALPAAAAADARLELSSAQLSLLVAVGLWARALAAGFAGALVDRFGGRRSLRDAAAGAAVAALLLGAVFASGRENALFVGVAVLQAALSYFLAFAGPAAARVNAARLEPGLRGRHAGMYGALAYPAELLALPAGLWLAARLPAAAVCFAPAAAATLALGAALLSPALVRADASRLGLSDVGALARKREFIVLAAIDACAGAARFGLAGWSAQFLAEVHQIRPGAPLFGAALAASALGLAAGALVAGRLSDRTSRPKAALAGFMMLFASLAVLGRVTDPAAAIAFLALSLAGASGAHAVIAGAAAMDLGGRRSAGAASGLFNASHHAAGGLALAVVGGLVNRGGWAAWTAALLPVSLAGAVLSFLLARTEAQDPRP